MVRKQPVLSFFASALTVFFASALTVQLLTSYPSE